MLSLWVGPPLEWALRWSRSQSYAGIRHPGGDTCLVFGIDPPSHFCGGSSPGDAGGDDVAIVVGDGVPPLRFDLCDGGVAGNVGNDRPVTGQFTGSVGQFGERG